MNKSTSIKELAGALAEFQSMVEDVKKDGTNPFYKSRYATLDKVIETIRPSLKECGLSFSQFPDYEGLTTILMHKSGEFIEATYKLMPKDATPQGYGSAISYARRYALCAILGLALEDDDGQEASKGPHTTSKLHFRMDEYPKHTPANDAHSLPPVAAKKVPRTLAKLQDEGTAILAAKDRIKALLTKLGHKLETKADYSAAVSFEVDMDLSEMADLASLQQLGALLADKVVAQQ